MGEPYHESQEASGGVKPLFDSLKRVWLTSLARPDILRDDRAAFPTCRAGPVRGMVVVSRPPPARVLP